MDLIDRIQTKIYADYGEFKSDMLKKSPEDIFDENYKIFCIEEIKVILLTEGEFTTEELRVILDFKKNILEQIYDEWLDSSYSCHDELVDSINTTLRKLRKRNQS